MSKLVPLSDAIRRHVRSGQHLNFASTPSRSNAAIRELARAFVGKAPAFTLSATGFHGPAHLLGMLRLGACYISCFFGDNCPVSRPNPLYRKLIAEGAELEHWSLWTYVSALRAAAFGHPYAITHSLSGTSLGHDLANRGKYTEFIDPSDPSSKIGQVRALSPDIVFIHGAVGDESGRVLFTPPYSEGFYGALAARLGVIVTVERIVARSVIDSLPHLVPLPTERVLAICEEPFGAHPQPLHVSAPELPHQSYRDDYEHYELWRRMTSDGALFQEFKARVLDQPDAGSCYREFVGNARLENLRRLAGRNRRHGQEARSRATSSHESSGHKADLPISTLKPAERAIVLGARTIARRVREAKHRTILAGLGQSFAASRLAKILLTELDYEVELVIETGIVDVDVWNAHPFLLSQENIASAARLTSVELVLGTLVCGGQNRCLAVIGAGEIDERGNVNSSYSRGEFLVGSGGAADIATCAREVIVISKCDRERMVAEVSYVTSPGHRVTHVVTEDAVFARESARAVWQVRDSVSDAARASVAERCVWKSETPDAPSDLSPLTNLERSFLAALASAHNREAVTTKEGVCTN